MAESKSNPAETIGSLIHKLALELSFVEPGKDNGLLPINCFLAEVEDLVRSQSVPSEIAAATLQARQWIDRLFETTAQFDAPTIQNFSKWQIWMSTAVEQWQNGEPCPPVSEEWSQAGAAASKPAVSTPAGDSRATPASAPAGEPVLTLSLDSDRELLQEFLNESQEHLQNIENGVLVLEENPKDADTLNSIFRAFHTFKGGSGFLNLTPIKNLAHELESLLDAARQHKLEINSGIINVILEGGDTLKQFVAEISNQVTGGKPQGPIVVPTLQLIDRVQRVLADPESALTEAPKARSNAVSENQPAAGSSPAAGAPSAAPSAEGAKSSGGNANAASNAGGFVKVDTAKLDSLIDLVGELVIAESMVVQDPDMLSLPSRHLARNLAQLRRITSDLQRTAMSLRMVPIRATFQKMNRLVRDLAAKQQKEVHLVLSGEETELDRNIVEAISDPLVHMIRNAADHGVEKPEARVARGKPAQGTIHLRAFHRGGNIVIQIQDDGNGLNKDKLLAKAREKGIVKPNESLTDKQIYELIFAPGFSTAEQITDISGRGVGMDVVRRNIEKLRGKVDIETTAGQGTTFTIYLPLTLAIIDGMIVSVGGERYIIPTLSVRESFRPKPEMLSTVHERGEMVNVRGRLSPLLRLYQYFGQRPKVTDPAQAIVVVVESGDHTRCLMVDELSGKQEVVIKSLGGALKKNAALAGGAVLGDGRVGLILNVDALVKSDHSTSLKA